MAKAIANQRGYYPLYEGGPNRIVEEGETFDLVGKFTKAKWFTPLAEVKGAKPQGKPEGKPEGEQPLA